MAILALVLSLFVAALGALGVVAPHRLLAVARRFASPAGVYLAAALRLLLGAALIVSADRSRAPVAVQLLGAFLLVAGIVTPWFGHARAARILAWWAARGPAFQRAWAALALVFGLLLAYAVAPGAAG